MLTKMKKKFRGLLDRSELIRLRTLSLRRKIWFKVLNKMERALINLTIKVVDVVRSRKLTMQLSSIANKIRSALQDKLLSSIKKVGLPLAQKLSFLAQLWGNKSAREWAFDITFARFLAIVNVNNPVLSTYGKTSQQKI